jgi:hypothetical protein
VNQQGLFVAEMIVDKSLGYAGSSGYLVNGDTLIAFFPEKPFGCLQDRLISFPGVV